MKSTLAFALLIMLSFGAQAWPEGIVAEIMLQANRSIPTANLANPSSVFDYYRAVLFQLRTIEGTRDQALQFYNEDVESAKPRHDLNFSKRALLEAQTRLDQFLFEQNLPPDTKLQGTFPPKARDLAKKTYTEVRNSMLQALNYNLVRHHRAEFFEGDPQGDFLKYLDSVFKKELIQAIASQGKTEITSHLISQVEKQIGRIKLAYYFYILEKTNKSFQSIITGLLELEQYHGLKVDLNGFWKSLWVDFKARIDQFSEILKLRAKAEQAQMCIQMFR